MRMRPSRSTSPFLSRISSSIDSLTITRSHISIAIDSHWIHSRPVARRFWLGLLLNLSFSIAFSLHKIASDHPQVFGGSVDQVTRFSTLFESAEQGRNLYLRIEMRTRSSMSKMSNTTKTTMLYPSKLQSAPSHWMYISTRDTGVSRRKAAHWNVVGGAFGIDIWRIARGYFDTPERSRWLLLDRV
jgi:hypothetical protein